MELQGIKVLIVEDDPVFRQLIGDYCRQQRMTVFEAEDGQHGLEAFERHRPDLVLVDLSMPRMDGQELLTRLVALDPELPSIVITANKAMSEVVLALRNGAWDYLMKPLSDFTLLKTAMLNCLEESGHIEPVAAEEPEPDKPEPALAMRDNFDLLQEDVQTATLVQAQLFPEPQTFWQSGRFDYAIFKAEPVSDLICDGFACGPDHYCTYLGKMHPGENSSAFLNVVIRSFFNQKRKRCEHSGSTTILTPFAMLSYLNEQLIKSELGCELEMVFVVLSRSTGRVALARCGSGIRAYLRTAAMDEAAPMDLLSPIMIPNAPPIGVEHEVQPACHFRNLGPGQSLVLFEGDAEIRHDLLSDRFGGLQQGERPGGYLQLTPPSV
ncbi:response regulator [Ferrimonas gelatinilytica]|uniref:Response regulator n=1 Tax=Ferrimonas gelatinilytica TaxID=1255257 RepID=A0ABP9RST0_9GAMM